MKLKLLFSAALISLSATSFAQSWVSDSVDMGAGYANEAFYSIKQGSNLPKAGSDWDLAFQMTKFGEPQFNACVRANHAYQGIEVYSLNLSAAARWATITAADTIGKTGIDRLLYNNDTSWGTGAFYQNRKISDPFTYGWGNYNPNANHAVIGDSVYLILQKSQTATNAYKFWVEKYTSLPNDSIRYLFHIANLDGTSDRTVTLWRKSASADFSDRLFAYYNIASATILNREPVRAAWDLVFTRYSKLIPAGPGGSLVLYPYMGILSNLGIEVADVRHVSSDDASFTYPNAASYTRTTQINEIGDDWKKNDPITHLYVLTDSTSFVIKNNATPREFWQIRFTRFDGSSNGRTVFEKRFLGIATAVTGPAALSIGAYSIAPNPATTSAMLMIDAKTATPAARILITDMAGRTVMNIPADVKAGLNAFQLSTAALATGTYAVQVAGGDWKIATRLVVAH